MTDGLLVIDKPAGMTSHDVVDHVRRSLKTKKVGHAGTLDPDATGLLLVGVGKATRFLTYAQTGPKSYRANARFGIATSTQDASGEIVSQSDGTITADHLRTLLDRFTGDIRQVPPMVSAVKVGGERLYKKARRGEDVARAARSVTVSSLELVDFDAATQTGTFDITCSGGTYVRTLINDIGEALGVGAHMTALRRTATGGFTLDEAIALDDVGQAALLPLVEVVRSLPKVKLAAADAELVRNGRPLEAGIAPDLVDGAPATLVADDELVAIYKRAGDVLIADRVVGS